MDFAIQHDGQIVDTVGALTASSEGTLITADGSANTKGSWTQLIASTLRPSRGLYLLASCTASAIADMLLDIGIGGAGSEVVLIGDLPLMRGSIGAQIAGIFPIDLPAGTRIAARCQSTLASATGRVSASLFAGGFSDSPQLSVVTTYGANPADSGGTSVDPGGTVHTKGAWSVISAATTRPIRSLFLGIGNQTFGTSRPNASWIIDVGVGAEGSEVVIVPDLVVRATSSDDTFVPGLLGPFPVQVPAGSRIAVRAQSSYYAIEANRSFDAIIIGVD